MKNRKICVLGLCGNSVFLQVDHFHRPGETVTALGRYCEPGGKGYNQAVAAARLGGEVAYLGAIGEDSDGAWCMEFLKKEGITPVPQVIPGLPSAYACILTDRQGENQVTVYRGAAELLSPEFVEKQSSHIAGSSIVLLNNEYPQSCNEAAMAIAKNHGVTVVYNPAPARAVSREFLKGCHLITPNLSETEILLGRSLTDPGELVQAFRDAGLPRAVVTLGSQGSLLIEADRALLFPCRKVTAVDTTGAGDTFTAALCVALLEDRPLSEAVEFAANAAALSVSRKYVMPGLPTREDLEHNFQKLNPIIIRR